MKTSLECFPCVLRQALEAAKLATEDSSMQREILDHAMELLIGLELDATPPEIAQKVHRLIRKISGNPDPYAGMKRHYNERALETLPLGRSQVEAAADPLEAALRLAIAGNVIDFGAKGGCFNLDEELRTAMESPFGLRHYDQFRKDLDSAESILYLGDNTGEIVFDKLLVERIRILSSAEVTFVVRGSPVLNDATMEDARFVGLDEVVPVVDNGSDAPATVLSDLRPGVRKRFDDADLIIAKGQGNYESLNDIPANIYFFFKVKCPVAARDVGVDEGKYVLACGRLLREGKRPVGA